MQDLLLFRPQEKFDGDDNGLITTPEFRKYVGTKLGELVDR